MTAETQAKGCRKRPGNARVYEAISHKGLVEYDKSRWPSRLRDYAANRFNIADEEWKRDEAKSSKKWRQKQSWRLWRVCGAHT